MTSRPTETEFQNHSARWLLLLTFIHTIPVLWLTPVSGGTAPTVAFFAYALVTLPHLTLSGATFALYALVPGLVYLFLAWLIAWALARLLSRLPRFVRILLLAAIVVPLLLVVYQPIYLSGGHGGSSSYDLRGLVDDFSNRTSVAGLKAYWIGLHGLLAILFFAQFASAAHPLFAVAERLRKPVIALLVLIMLIGTGFQGYPSFICRPLAGLGIASAQVCVARVSGNQARYWYERAAVQDNLEAITWMAGYVDGAEKAYWIRKGAEAGDGVMQYALHRRLARSRDANKIAEAGEWLKRAAKNDHPAAQMKVVGQLYTAANRTKSEEQLAAHNTLLERAAKQGSRDAKLQLAQHYTNGSMGYSADFARARAYYRDLVDHGEPSEDELRFGHDKAYYLVRIAELDGWALGLKNQDSVVMKLMAKRYLSSQLPGEGVRELGLGLMEQLADSGNEVARDELMLGLRTGSGGVPKDRDAAKRMQLEAANAGDLVEMERVRANYFGGQQGYPLDYLESRRWIGALLEIYQARQDDQSQARVRQLQKDLAYIDRIEQRAGGTLLTKQQLAQLGRSTDAESHYQFALQVLVGQGSGRRAEAIRRLNKASSLGHGEAAWRLVQIYERGFPGEINRSAALRQLQTAVANHQFDASKELAFRYEAGKKGVQRDLRKAVALYEATLAAAEDNRYGWNLDRNNYNHFSWVKSRLKQARGKLESQLAGASK